MRRSLFDKIWDAHVVEELPGGNALVFMDLVVAHEITTPPGAITIEREFEDRLLTRDIAVQRAFNTALPHYNHTIRDPKDLGQFGGDHHDCAPAHSQLVDHVVDFVLRAHVDATRGLVENHDPQIWLSQPAR